MEQAQITCLCLEFQPGWKPKLWFWLSPESGSQLRPVFLLQRRNDLLPRGPDSLRCWLCSESSLLCTEKLSIMSKIKTRDKQKRCDFWGGELGRVGAAVQRSVLGRGISNTCLIIRVKYWVGTLAARVLSLWRLAVGLCPSGPVWEGVPGFTPRWRGSLTLVQSDGWQLFSSLEKRHSIVSELERVQVELLKLLVDF